MGYVIYSVCVYILEYMHVESLVCKTDPGHYCGLGQTLNDRLQELPDGLQLHT